MGMCQRQTGGQAIPTEPSPLHRVPRSSCIAFRQEEMLSLTRTETSCGLLGTGAYSSNSSFSRCSCTSAGTVGTVGDGEPGTTTSSLTQLLSSAYSNDDDDDVELHVLGCRVTLGTNCDQCRSLVQCCFTSTETIRLVRTGSPGRPPRLSHSS